MVSFLFSSRHDSGVSISSSLSSEPDVRRPSNIVSGNFADIGPPPAAIPEDEQFLFNDDGEVQESPDSDEEDVFTGYPTTSIAMTLPPTASSQFQAHIRKFEVSRSVTTLTHHEIASRTTRSWKVPWHRKPPISRTVSVTDIASSSGEQVQLIRMRMTNSFDLDDDRMYISAGAQGVAPRDLVGITSPQPSSPLSQSSHSRIMRSTGPRRRRNAVMRRSTFDLDILQPPIDVRC